MSRYSAILDLRGPGADHHLLDDKAVAALVDASTWHPQRAARAQTRDQLALERTPTLHIQRLLDRLMADPHRRIVGEIDLQPIRDLLRAPRLRPAPILAPSMPTTDPAHARTHNLRATRRRDHTGQPLLHVHAQRLVREELGDLRPPPAPIGMPLRGRRPILELAASCRRVASQLAQDRAGDWARTSTASCRSRSPARPPSTKPSARSEIPIVRAPPHRCDSSSSSCARARASA